ncbi:MAG: zinc-binding dehydrogenase, partial [Deltaproteobacteria bacterium]|nr:zinc-binding dehydrogenase [Deltaproteobacteria bacterium]
LVRAKELGAEIVDDARVESTVKVVRELTGGRGADLTVDAAARGASPRQAVEMTRKGGRVVLTGVPLEPVELPLQRMVLEEMDIYGVRANRGTCEEVIPLIANGRINARALVTHIFPLAEFHKAYETFTKRIDGALKVLVQPNPEPGRRRAGDRLPAA